jgi:hypothetical protein
LVAVVHIVDAVLEVLEEGQVQKFTPCVERIAMGHDHYWRRSLAISFSHMKRR